MNAPTPAASSARTTTLFLAFGIGTLVSVGLGVYARLHETTFFAFNLAGFSSGTAAKAWLATLAFAARAGPAHLGVDHVRADPGAGAALDRHAAPLVGAGRGAGHGARRRALPLRAGFETTALRGLVHSVAGCFFYGAFVAKMLVLQRHEAPSWALPVLGGAVFTGLTVLWLTAAAWFFGTSGLHF